MTSTHRLRFPARLVPVALGLVSAVCAADSTQDRLDALEARLAALEAENTHLRTRLGEVASPPAPTAADRAHALRVSGYTQIHAGFGGAPDARFVGTDDRLFIRRVDLAVKGDLAADFDFKIEAELSSGSLGEKSGHTPRLTDAYVRWQGSDQFGLKVGQFKSAFGRAQLMPNTKLPWVERPLASDRLTVSRQVGLAAEGQLGGELVPTTYQFGIYNGTGANNSFSVNSRPMTAGRLETLVWSDDDASWTLAANAYHYNPGAGRRLGWGVDTAVSRGPLRMEAEYLNVEYADLGRTADGWWVSGLWTVVPDWQAVLAVGSYDPDTGLPADDTLSWTVGTSTLLDGDNLKLTLNYLWGDAPTGREGRLLSRLQVKF